MLTCVPVIPKIVMSFFAIFECNLSVIVKVIDMLKLQKNKEITSFLTNFASELGNPEHSPEQIANNEDTPPRWRVSFLDHLHTVSARCIREKTLLLGGALVCAPQLHLADTVR